MLFNYYNMAITSKRIGSIPDKTMRYYKLIITITISSNVIGA